MTDILIFAQEGCDRCQDVHDRLTAADVPHRYEYLDSSHVEHFFNYHGLEGDDREFPQIMVDGQRIGGADAVTELL